MNRENLEELGPRLTREVLDPMKQVFVGKDEIIDLMGVCLVAGENLFIHGPPGTAKSALVHELGRRLDGRTFQYLLTKFTEPSELFGPFDIRRLREGELVTNTEGMLPEAALIFLDELLNANSAILNSLLLVLNERLFRRGRETRALPVLMVVGSSNRLPEDEALEALFDRFLMRVRCENVPEERLGEVLSAGWKLDLGMTHRAASFKVEEIRKLNSMLKEADLSPAREAYIELIGRLRSAGITVSDRRAVKLQRLAAASAVLCGRAKAQVSDLWIFRYIWDTEDQQQVIAALVRGFLDRAGAEEGAHPRSRADERPDPEALARDLEALGAEGATPGEVLRDKLRLIESRCQWVAEAAKREELQRRVQRIWESLGKIE
jgi:MoxR-like ATPase